MSQQAIELLKIPAVLLKVSAAIGAVLELVWILMVAFGVTMAGMEGGDEAMGAFFGGGVQVAFSVLGLGIAAFLWVGASRMTALRSYGMCMAAAIVAMIPCLSPCCLLTIIPGIWALVVLLKPEVKSAFTS